MSNMNGRDRDKKYPEICSRDGEFCKGCGKLPGETKEGFLLIDHKDNDNSNNELGNLQLLCRRCNYLKNPRGNRVIEERPKSAEMKANTRMEPYFRKWLFGLISENHKWLLEDVIDSGAERCQGSTETIKRYLRKCVSTEGIYEIVEGQQGREFIQFKAEFR